MCLLSSSSSYRAELLCSLSHRRPTLLLFKSGRKSPSARLKIEGLSSVKGVKTHDMDAHSSTVTDVTSASSDSDTDAHSSTATSALVPAPANEARAEAALPAGGAEVVEFEGMVFTVTERNEVAEVLEDGSVCVLDSESYLREDTGTQEHLVDVYWERERMLFQVSVREDQRRIVRMVRWF